MKSASGTIYREFKMVVQNRVNLALSIVPPVVYILLFATSMGNVVRSLHYEGKVIPYQAFVIPGVIVMSMVGAGTASAGLLFSEEMGGMLVELFSYPVRKRDYVFGRLGVSSGVVLVQALITLGVASIIFGFPLRLSRVPIIIIMILGTSVSLNLGYLYVASRFRSQQRFLIIMNLGTPIVTFAAPTFYPYESMPRVLQLISWANPVSYGVQLIRGGLFAIYSRVTVLSACFVAASLAGFLVLCAVRIGRRMDNL